MAKATVLIVHPDALEGALVAAQQVGIPFDRVIPLDTIRGPRSSTVAPDLHQLISYGLAHPPNFVERRLRPGEGKTKVAFLSFSSGTTGKPKVSTIYSATNNALMYYYRRQSRFLTMLLSQTLSRWSPGGESTRTMSRGKIEGYDQEMLLWPVGPLCH